MFKSKQTNGHIRFFYRHLQNNVLYSYWMGKTRWSLIIDTRLQENDVEKVCCRNWNFSTCIYKRKQTKQEGAALNSLA